MVRFARMQLPDYSPTVPNLIRTRAARFGAREWARKRFLSELAAALELETRRGRWHLSSEVAARFKAEPA